MCEKVLIQLVITELTALFTSLFSALTSLYSLISHFYPIPFLFPALREKEKERNKKKWSVIFVYITVFIVHDGEGVRGENQKKKRVGGLRRKKGELMYGWIKLSYPTPPPPGTLLQPINCRNWLFLYAMPFHTAPPSIWTYQQQKSPE